MWRSLLRFLEGRPPCRPSSWFEHGKAYGKSGGRPQRTTAGAGPLLSLFCSAILAQYCYTALVVPPFLQAEIGGGHAGVGFEGDFEMFDDTQSVGHEREALLQFRLCVDKMRKAVNDTPGKVLRTIDKDGDILGVVHGDKLAHGTRWRKSLK